MQDMLGRLAVIDVDAHEKAPSHVWGEMPITSADAPISPAEGRT